MNLRLCLLGALIAALPVAVDLPSRPDSLAAGSGETRVEATAGAGQFSIITRGCENEVLSEVKEHVDGGALALEHRFPRDWVVGVRGGTARVHVVSVNGVPFVTQGRPYTLRHVNPWVAYERDGVGLGAGWLGADGPFPLGPGEVFRPGISGHLRVGPPRLNVALRFMEDAPLLVNPYLQLEIGVQPRRGLELAFGPGFLGPFDGAALGVRGRVWLTPEAAMLVRAGLGSSGQYYVSAGATARIPDRRGQR
jgi:hypothetical protein